MFQNSVLDFSRMSKELKEFLIVHVRDGARFKYKLMGVMVYFSPAKNKHQSILRSRFSQLVTKWPLIRFLQYKNQQMFAIYLFKNI